MACPVTYPPQIRACGLVTIQHGDPPGRGGSQGTSFHLSSPLSERLWHVMPTLWALPQGQILCVQQPGGLGFSNGAWSGDATCPAWELHPAPVCPPRAAASPLVGHSGICLPTRRGPDVPGGAQLPPHPGPELLPGNGAFHPQGPSGVVPEKCRRGRERQASRRVAWAVLWGSDGHRGGGPSFLRRGWAGTCLDA